MLAAIEKLGELICEVLHLVKSSEIIPDNKVLDKADEICQTVLPDLQSLPSDDAMKVAGAAYDMAVKIKDALSPK